MIKQQPDPQPIDLPELTDSKVAQAWLDKTLWYLPTSEILENPNKFSDQNFRFIETYLANELQFLESHPEAMPHKPEEEDDQDA